MKLNDLLSFDNIIVQCHDYPDADTIASGYGLYCFLKSHDKKVRLIYSGTNQIAKPSLLIMVERLGIPIQYVKELSEKPQLLITADCVHGEKNVTDFDAHCYAAVDHHISVKNSSGLYEIRPEYASCSSIISVMLREAGYDFNDNRPLATSLYYGLFTDSNGMSEINHPADRDLRDFTVYDKELIMLLTNSVLTLDELKLAAEALNNVINDDRYHFAVTCARECDPNILGYINDLVLQVDTVDVSIVCCFISGGIKISVRSCISDIKAQELAKYITDTIGSGGGQNQKAGGFISSESVPHINAENIFSFIREKVKKYYRSFDVIRAEDFSADPSRMEVYIKKPQLLGYAVSTDIFEAGTVFRVRSLEADFEVTADDSLYILVDRYGSAYPSQKDKFESTYEPSNEDFIIGSDYKPHAISHDMHSKELVFSSCRSKGGTKIFAGCLERNTKLYTGWSKQSYTSGKAGDYLVVRMDDPDDMYIIERERFGEIYQRENRKKI